jgi:hypothetical protein
MTPTVSRCWYVENMAASAAVWTWCPWPGDGTQTKRSSTQATVLTDNSFGTRGVAEQGNKVVRGSGQGTVQERGFEGLVLLVTGACHAQPSVDRLLLALISDQFYNREKAK